MIGSDSGADSDSGSWKKYLNLSSDSEGQGQGPEHSEAEPASRKRGGTDPREDVGPSSVGPSGPYRSPGDRTPIQETAGQQADLESVAAILESHQRISERIQDLFRDLRTRVPGGFQAEHLAGMLEERHGGENMGEILRSLQTEGNNSPYFREIQTDFRILRNAGGTEMQLRKEWQGRA